MRRFRAISLLAALALVALLAANTANRAAEAEKSPAATRRSGPSPGQSLPLATNPAEGKAAEVKHVPDDDNYCIQCHATLTEKGQERLLVKAENFAGDAHWQKGLRCQDCHGGDPTVGEIKGHQANGDFRVVKSPAGLLEFCGRCHEPEKKELLGGGVGVHAKAGDKDDRGLKTPLACSKCHGSPAHHILPVRDSKSPVFLDNQVKTCGGCHPEHLKTYEESVHGQGLSKLGLLVTAVCANCHGAHGIYHGADTRSSLHPTRVAATCGKCHRFIEERLQASVHGGSSGAGGEAKRIAPGGKNNRKPSCTDCHQGHDLPDPNSLASRRQLPNRCGNCHANLTSRYALSLHGALTELGYDPAAKCSDCHGDHNILAVSNPHSPLSPRNRDATCRKCHPHAAGSFVNFDPHVDYTDGRRNPLVHTVYEVVLTFLLLTIGFFGLHSLLWFVRGIADVLNHGRVQGLRPGGLAYVRFPSVHRLGHTVLLVAFLGLALTGMPLKYSHTQWAKVMAQGIGGFPATSFWHRFFAVITFACMAAYLVRLACQFVAGRRRGMSVLGLVFGPDSPVPTWRDVKDFFAMLRWFAGLGPKPGFERWAYWEKFDFWGAAADILIIGSTGLVLWFPNFFCRFLPSKILERRPGDPFHPSLAGDGLRLQHSLLQHAFAAGQVSRGHVGDDRPGERRGIPGGAPRFLRPLAAGG